MPDQPEAIGLLALMLLSESRRPARVGPRGELVRLVDQDRALWNRALIDEGQRLVPDLPRSGTGQVRTRSRPPSTPFTATRRRRRGLTGGRSCSCTTSCKASRRVRWSRSTVLSRSRKSHGPHAALTIVERAGLRSLLSLSRNPRRPAPALGRPSEAALAYEAAISLCENAAEREFLDRADVSHSLESASACRPRAGWRGTRQSGNQRDRACRMDLR